MEHWNFTIEGKVQGVWFRKSTQNKALEMGLKGFVRNQPDGSVYAEVEGSPEQLVLFEKWCWEGSPLSEVTRVQYEKGNMEGFTDFVIRR